MLIKLKQALEKLPTEVKNHSFFTSTLFLWLLTIPFKNSIYQLSLFLISAISISHIIKFNDFQTVKKLFTRDKYLTLGIGLLLISMTVSNTFGLDPANGFETQLKFFYKYILLAFALQYLFEKNYFSLKTLTVFIVLSLFVHIFNGLFQSITSYDLFYQYPFHNDALTGAFQNRNIFGLFMLVSSGALSIIISKKMPQHYFLLIGIMFVASIYCLLFSYSRASWLAYAVFSLVFFLTSNKPHRLIASLVPIVIAIVLFTTQDGLSERLHELLIGFDSVRIEIWLWAVGAFEDSWLLGYGMETMHLVSNAPDQPFVHNAILEIAISLGILGLIPFIIIAWHILYQAFKTDKAGLFAFGLALLTISQFDHSILDGKRFIPILMIYATYVVISFHHQRNLHDAPC